MYLEEMSVEHLRNVQKLVDGMAGQAASMYAAIHAITLLYPELNSMNEFIDIRSKIEGLYVAGIGAPIATWLSRFSRDIQAIIDKRDKKIV